MEILSEPTSNKLQDELGSLRVNDGDSEAISRKEKEEIFWMNQSLLCSSKLNHSKKLAENGIGETVLAEDKDKEAGKKRDKNSPIECFEEVGSMEKLGENGGNAGVAMKCNVGDKLIKFDGKDNDLVILNKALDMLLDLSSSQDIHKYCDNESPKCNEAKSSIIPKIIENGDLKAMGNGINIRMFVRTKVESNHCESYETSSSKVKKAFSHLIVGTLTGSKKRKRAVKLVNDTEVFQEGSIRETLSRVKLGTYKELCNLENDMGQPDLIYKFMDLANHQATLKSKRGVAFGFLKLPSGWGCTAATRDGHSSTSPWKCQQITSCR
uniref:Proteasome-associated protein ECM29 homolog isoform X1 n=1 Tax=Tanacetum cinerariifolium TaxID=118510 RepID=A0A6L2NSI6_TANCI|nr:proteasome-associated protein ECM29 homolog isoform X1 [Tanacetum cinerariifolium]